MEKENKLIAEFMGIKYSDTRSFNDGEWTHSIKSLSQFRTSWEWLMAVVEKIEDMGYEIVITNGECTISGANDYYAESIGKSRRGATYKAVVEFINEYNENK